MNEDNKNYNNENLKQGEIKKVKEKRVKRLIAIIVIVLLIFAGLHIFAVYNGHNNIIKMVESLIYKQNIPNKKEEVPIIEEKETSLNDRKEIFSDEDITLYKTVNLNENLQLMITNIQRIDKNIKIIFKIKEKNVEKFGQIMPLTYKIYNQEKTKVYGEQRSAKNYENEKIYTEEIEISNVNNNEKILKLEVYQANKVLLKTVDIDLQNIMTISEKKSNIEKISEIELKKYLELFSRYVTSMSGVIAGEVPGKDEKDQYILESIMNVINELDKSSIYVVDTLPSLGIKVQDADFLINNIFGTKIENFKNGNSYKIYQKNNEKYYVVANGYSLSDINCLEISDIVYNNGIYKVTYQYSFFDDEMVFGTDLKNVSIYETTVELKLNESNEFSKYKLINFTKPICVQKTETPLR